MLCAGLMASFLSACGDDATGPGAVGESELVWAKEAFLLAPGWGGDDGHFYVSAGGVFAVEPQTGRVVWETHGGRVGPDFHVIGDVIVVEEGGLKGLRARDGMEIWNQPGAPVGSVIGSVLDGVLATDGEVLAAFDLQTGAEVWRADLERGGNVSLAAGDGVGCAARQSPEGGAVIQCFSFTDGALLWTQRRDRTKWITIADDVLVLAGGEPAGHPGWVGVDPRSGETIWMRPDLPVHDMTREPESELLINCDFESGDCFAVQARDGSVIWRASVGERMEGMLAGSERLVVFAPPHPERTSAYVLDIATGVLRGKIVADLEGVSGFCSGAAISRDLILTYGCGGFLLTYELP